MERSSSVIVYAIIDARSSPDHPLGDAIETLVRREDAERFVEEVRRDDPELGSYLRIEEGAGGGQADLPLSLPLQCDDPDEERHDDRHRDRL
jgi:hypothetical protein